MAAKKAPSPSVPIPPAAPRPPAGIYCEALYDDGRLVPCGVIRPVPPGLAAGQIHTAQKMHANPYPPIHVLHHLPNWQRWEWRPVCRVELVAPLEEPSTWMVIQHPLEELQCPNA